MWTPCKCGGTGPIILLQDHSDPQPGLHSWILSYRVLFFQPLLETACSNFSSGSLLSVLELPSEFTK